jgi:DNA modification methylase
MTLDMSVEIGNAEDGPGCLSGIKLLWTDPPYCTGKRKSRAGLSYPDPADPERIVEALNLWLPAMDCDGTVCVCVDYHAAPAIAGALGWTYRGEIVWEFGLGRPRTSWWPVRHNNILTFTRTPKSGLFDADAAPRTKRIRPKVYGKDYGDTKPSGSVWDFTMSNNHSERVRYPNQKPLEIIAPFILAHTHEGDLVADPFCGSSSTGAAAIRHGRRYYGRDSSSDAVATSIARLDIEKRNLRLV